MIANESPRKTLPCHTLMWLQGQWLRYDMPTGLLDLSCHTLISCSRRNCSSVSFNQHLLGAHYARYLGFKIEDAIHFFKEAALGTVHGPPICTSCLSPHSQQEDLLPKNPAEAPSMSCPAKVASVVCKCSFQDPPVL